MLEEIGDVHAVEQLCGALRDPDPTVRHAASRALGKIREARAIEPVLIALKGPDPAMRHAEPGKCQKRRLLPISRKRTRISGGPLPI